MFKKKHRKYQICRYITQYATYFISLWTLNIMVKSHKSCKTLFLSKYQQFAWGNVNIRIGFLWYNPQKWSWMGYLLMILFVIIINFVLIQNRRRYKKVHRWNRHIDLSQITFTIHRTWKKNVKHTLFRLYFQQNKHE